MTLPASLPVGAAAALGWRGQVLARAFGVTPTPPSLDRKGALAIVRQTPGLEAARVRRSMLKPLDVGAQLTGYDGSHFHPNKDGSEDQTCADGTRVHVNPDGSALVTSPDGTKATVRTDGSQEIHGADGSQTLIASDGSFVYQPKSGHAAAGVIFPDGHRIYDVGAGITLIDYPNGASLSVGPSGAVIVTLQRYDPWSTLWLSDDGTVMAAMDAAWLWIAADGSVTGTTNSTGLPASQWIKGNVTPMRAHDPLVPVTARFVGNDADPPKLTASGKAKKLTSKGVIVASAPSGLSIVYQVNGVSLTYDPRGFARIRFPKHYAFVDFDDEFHLVDTHGVYRPVQYVRNDWQWVNSQLVNETTTEAEYEGVRYGAPGFGTEVGIPPGALDT